MSACKCLGASLQVCKTGTTLVLEHLSSRGGGERAEEIVVVPYFQGTTASRRAWPCLRAGVSKYVPGCVERSAKLASHLCVLELLGYSWETSLIITTVPADEVCAALDKKDKDTSGGIKDVDTGTATATELVLADEDDDSAIATFQGHIALPPQSTLLRHTSRRRRARLPQPTPRFTVAAASRRA